VITWMRQHRVAFVDAWRRLLTAPFNTALSLLVISIALTLPAMGLVLLDNLRSVANQGGGAQQISIFMKTDADKKALTEIERRLRMANIGEWRLVNKETAFKHLARSEEMVQLLKSLPKNPLPDAFIVEPERQTPKAMEALTERFWRWPQVAQVQLDAAWVRRLNAILRFGQFLVALLGAAFAAGLVAVMFNTIRLQILSHAAEIEVARLIGATDAYIHRPFYYYGALQGVLGGLLALVWVVGGGWLLARPVAELSALYNGQFALTGITPWQSLALVAISTALGWLGARISVSLSLRYLQ